MRATIQNISHGGLLGLISSTKSVKLTDHELKTMSECVSISKDIWVGLVDGQLACAWGLIPPSLLSHQAYLWLYTTPKVEEEKFLFVRHSQRAVEDMLKRWSTLVGYCDAMNERAIRWVKWLGGEFDAVYEGKVNFRIRKRSHG